jgi:hypothetical protein
LQGTDYSQQFHAVVGSQAKAFRKFFPVLGKLQYGPISPRTWVAFGGTVGKNDNHDTKK